MAKYVCDFEAVQNAAVKLDNMANEMTETLAILSSNIDAETSSWSGEAKNNFIASNNSQIDLIKSQVTFVTELAQFMRDAASQIESTDSSLAGLSI